uniref:DNA-directed DNA polymerase n=1 Tax=Tanacetum cinerariifolium TaxID=118510 RepID=A0A6L2LBM5_TANCI|nr:DNA-directed DNA polymerase [Tanacetum cinerariifolium]
MNEHCFAVLLKKLPEKLGDPGKFLIPCDFLGMVECLALADLDAIINLMPFSVWKRLSLPDLTPTCMTLELDDRSISRPVRVAEDVYVKVGSFHFLADFVVVDFDADPRVPLILGRSFLKSERAFIDVFEGELTLRVGKEAITFNLDQTSRYSANYSDMTAKRIDVIDMACKEYSQEVLGFSDTISSGNPTPYNDPIVFTTSSTLTPFGYSDFLLEEVDAFLAIEDEPTSSEFHQSYLDPEGDILLLESFLNGDPSLPPPNQRNYLPKVRKEFKICEAKSDKSLVDEPPIVELKVLPPHIEYAFLEGDDKLPVIIAKDLSVEEKTAFITKIHMKEDFKPIVQHQKRVNPKIHDIIKQEVIKLLDAGLIYPIFDSPWVSPVHCIPKKEGFTVVENDDNELILTRLVTGWRVCIDYHKLNEATQKDHFPLPFMDQMLERLAGNQYYCFLDGFSGYFQILIDPKDQEKTTFACPYGTFAYRRMPFGLCNAPGTFQRCMMAIFHDMIEKTMEVFMDDFSVFRNSFQSCLSHLERMLKRCEDTNLCLNWENSHFMVKRIPNIVEPEIRSIEEIVSMADRTMEELLHAPTEGYGEAIVISKILAENFEIKTNLLQLVQANKFYGFERDNPHTHINFELVEIVNKQVITPAAAKVVEKTCVTCGGAHAYYDCIATDSNQPSVCVATGSYNQVSPPNRDSHQIPPPGFALEENLRRNLNNDMRSILGSFFQNQPSTLGTLPSNIVPNPKGEMKAVTTRSGLAYEGPSIPTNSPLEKVDEQNTKEITDKEHSNCPGSTAQVQSLVVPISILEPDVPRTQSKPTIPYPFADALLLMPKFASTIKSLLANKDKLFELAKVPLNENCSAMLLKKLPKKLGDPVKFLIPYDFPGMDVCHALADLGASINLMPLSIWKKLSLPELTPTRMTLEQADRSITRPKGVTKDVFFKMGKFYFPTDFVVVDFEVDPRVPLILGRSFLRTGRALIDVYGEEITLRVNDESVTFNLNQTMRYSSTYDDNFMNRVDVINIACEEFVQDVLDLQYNPKSNNPTLVSDSSISKSDFSKEPIVKSSSPTLTSFGENPFQLPPMDLKLAEESKAKFSIEKPPELELKELTSHLEYAFLEESNKLPVIIAKDLKDVEKEALIKVLKSHKRAISWKISDIKGINPRFYTHKILMEDDYKPAVQSQRRVNPKIHDVIKKEVIKLLDVGMIYPISDSPWVSPIHCVPKKGGMIVVANENNELIPTRLVTGWRVCIDYRKLNDATRKDHFSLPFMDQMLKKLAGNEFYCFLDGFSGYFQIPIDPQDQEKTTFTCPYGTFAYRRMPFGLCNAPGNKISKSGIKVDRAKVDVIAKLPHPTTVKGVRSFLGHAGFYRRFIQDFSKFARPMTHLLEKETPFVFSKECVDAFNTLKNKLTEDLILVVPDWNLPFELMCDASDFVIGAVLRQRKTKHFQPIHYASKTMTEAQIHYTTTEKEMLVVRRLLRWVLLLQEFDITILDKKGSENLAADHLSRLENPHKDVLENKDINENFLLETLGSLSYNSTPWFDDIANFHAGNFIKKGLTSQQKKKFFKDLLKSSKLSMRDLLGAIMVPISQRRRDREKSLREMRCLRTLSKFVRYSTYRALKHVNFDLKTAGDHRKLQLNELSEFHDQAYENSVIYKERTKKLHDSKIKNRIFNVGDQVLLFNSRLKIFSEKLKTRWSGPFTITQVFPYGTIKLSQPDGPNFKVNGHCVKHYFGGDIPSNVVSDLHMFPMDK